MTIRPLARRITTATSRRANRILAGTFKSVARLNANLARLVRRVNGDRVTAAAYLTSIGADDDTIRRYASQLGKHATRIMRESGAEPKRNGLAVITRHGRAGLVEVNTYTAAVLADATAGYTRTAHLVNGAS